MSCESFNRALTNEIDRLDDLYNDKPERAKARIDHPLLESFGMAVVASRVSALRRELLADIAIRAMADLDHQNEDSKHWLVVIPNHNHQHFQRQMLAQISGLKFSTLDTAQIEDEEWPKLTSGVNHLFNLSGTVLKDGEEEDTSKSRLRWEMEPVSLSMLVDVVTQAVPESTVILENFHLITDISNHAEALRNLRNAAAKSGVYLYLGCGLNHWREVRGNGHAQLSDLPESLMEAVHVADRITILTSDAGGKSTTIFDPRYGAPWAD